MAKKFLILFSFFFIFIMNFQKIFAVNSETTNYIDIKINNQYIKFSSDPFIFNSVSYIPLRSFAETISAEINWNENEKSAEISAEISKEIKKLKFYSNKKTAVVNNQAMLMNTEALNINDKIYVPVRFVADMLGGKIEWDGFYQNACLTFDNIELMAKNINYDYTDDDIFWLGRIIEAESGGEPLKGKIAVGNVILNRVKSENFPDSIYGVIFDRNYGVQFQPVINGTVYNTPGYDSVKAAKYALKGQKPVGECLYFLNPRTAQNRWIINNRIYHSSIKNHDFYL